MGVKNNPEVIDKERRVLEMRLAGITFDAIAKNVGYAVPVPHTTLTSAP
jgi:hypothetical protein